MFGAKYNNHQQKTEYYIYNELFRSGADVEYLPYTYVRSAKTMDGFKGMPFARMLMPVFGYD